MAEIELTEDQVLDQTMEALRQLESWAYALPKAKEIIQGYQLAKTGLDKGLKEKQAVLADLEKKMSELQPLYDEKERKLKTAHLANVKEFNETEERMRQGIAKLREEGNAEQAALAEIKQVKSTELAEINAEIAELKRKRSEAEKSYKDFLATFPRQG